MFAKQRKILIAEDNRSLRKVLEIVFQDEFTVKTVDSGAALEEELQCSNYDLLITDINLSDCFATQVLRKCGRMEVGKTTVEGLSIPTIVITGMSPEDEEVQCARRMVNVLEVFHKPLDMTRLHNCVRDQLQSDAGESIIMRKQEFHRSISAQTILIVDDDPGVRMLLSSFLEQEGYQVRACGTAAEGLQLCKEGSFGLILLDYFLDDLVANDFLQELTRVREAHQTAAVLLITGFADALGMDRFIDYPMVKGILAKPFDFGPFLEQVSRHIEPAAQLSA